MAFLVNRLTLEPRYSANTPDYSEADWLINPSMPPGVPWRYLKIGGEDLIEMSQSEKDEVDAAASEAEFSRLRRERDARLAMCDWTQLDDVSMSLMARQQWQLYRQALRDLPANTEDPTQPVWPEPPTE